MAKKFRRSKASRKPHIPMALALPALSDALYIYSIAKDGLTNTEMTNLGYMYTGWNGRSLDVGRLFQTYGKYAAGGLISLAATKTGINRRIYKFTKGYVGI